MHILIESALNTLIERVGEQNLNFGFRIALRHQSLRHPSCPLPSIGAHFDLFQPQNKSGAYRAFL
jgi:hypothetical protein